MTKSLANSLPDTKPKTPAQVCLNPGPEFLTIQLL